MEGWIKLYRKFSEWEWFNISEMVHLFIYLLLNANHEEGEWRGVIIKRGQILTGLNSLHQHTKISYQKLRTCLKRLEKTKEINIQSTNKYSIITVCNYECYQNGQQTNNNQTNKQLTNNQQTTNIQLTTNKKEEKENTKKNEKKFIAPSLSEVETYFEENGYKCDIAIRAFNYYDSADWKDSKGNQVKNWKQKMIAVWFKDENKIIVNNDDLEYEKLTQKLYGKPV